MLNQIEGSQEEQLRVEYDLIEQIELRNNLSKSGIVRVVAIEQVSYRFVR